MALSSLLFASLALLAAAGTTQAQAAEKRRPGAFEGRQQRVPRAFYTTSWAVEITSGGEKMADAVARRYGFYNFGKIDGLEGIYHFKLNQRERLVVSRYSPYTAKSKRLSTERSVGFIEQQAVRPRTAKSYEVPNDPLFQFQWQLLNTEQLGNRYQGNDLRVEQAWLQGLTGCNITVTIVDDGLDFTHRDLWKNYVPTISYDFVENDNDPSNIRPFHGTACGGIVGASKDYTCGVGIAHEVNLGGVALLGANTDINEAQSLSYKRETVDIYSNSWGPFDSGRNVEGPEYLTSLALKNGVREGREGKGSIFVWANGNGGVYDDCAADGYASSIYTISVGAVGVDGRPSPFDEVCSAKMVVTYVTNDVGDSTVCTTSLNGGCNTFFGGTSAATPLAASILALALEANPSLTWRDVQYLIVYTANPNLTVGPQTRNGAGLVVSHQYGFGVMDAEAIVTRARHWINVPPQIKDTAVPRSTSRMATHTSPLELTVRYGGSIQYLEHVVVNLTLSLFGDDDKQRADITMKLKSPTGTVSTLLSHRSEDSFSEGFLKWPFMSVMFWGERPAGNWTLSIISMSSSTRVRVTDLKFQFYGVSSVPEAVENIPDQCHSDCRRGCAKEGSNFCDSCVNLRNAYTLECITECPPGYTERNGYCYNASYPNEECISPMKYKEEATCAEAGYTGCCTDENCQASIESSPFSCFCDALCYTYNDCCNDIADIGCTETNTTGQCGELPYITMGVTAGVRTLAVPIVDDGTSNTINKAFPIGYSVEQQIQVGTNGYFTFDGFDGFIPFPFEEKNQSIVAPFFTDIDISDGFGLIEYEVHTEATSRPILSEVNKLINNCTEKQFTGTWLLVATWEDVPWYGQSINITSTFQGILITDSVNSYAVFTYFCGDLSYSSDVAIGYGTEDGLYANHEATYRGSADLIACLNYPTSPWVNVVYELTRNVNECEEENGGCEQICINTIASFKCSCMAGYTLNSDGHTCSDIDECLNSEDDCGQTCMNVEGSYSCSCVEGFALNEDGRSCSISCGGTHNDVNGSFHTPHWPQRYPFENFRCEWVIDIENKTDSIIEISFDEPYGINGQTPCPTDYVEVFDGVEEDSASFGKNCYRHRPLPIMTSSNRAKVVFQGSARDRTPSRVGISISYTMVIKVNECEVNNSGCDHVCVDTTTSYVCSCRDGYELDDDQHRCIDVDECLTDTHGCHDICSNNEGSYTCGCVEGLALNEDGRSCSISCGGTHNDVNGSFHTPYWPHRYPSENFRCEWVIDIENMTDSIIEISFDEPYGINGQTPCPTDYVEVFDGVEEDSASFGKNCYRHRPLPIMTSSNRAKVVFQGSARARTASRVGVSISYLSVRTFNECEIDNGGCEHVCLDTTLSHACSCHGGYKLDMDNKRCIDIDECSTGDHGCEYACDNMAGSYSCSCDTGFALNEDGRSCSISCGGTHNDVNGSFHTPYWPHRYPSENFRCEWVIDIENMTDSIIEISFDEPYGINGQTPCPTDYVEVFDGVEEDSASFGKNCFVHRPLPIMTSSNRAKVVFQGSARARTASRVGVSVAYKLKQKVNECEIDNGGCSHTCQDSPSSYSCGCPDGFTLGTDRHNCSDTDECSSNNGGCQQGCVNNAGSYYCECRDGYALDDNGITCSISCDKLLVESSGSFQTPGWPGGYPQADFTCEWTINTSANSSIEFNVVSSAYGINGRPPCERDYLQFFDGLESSSPSLGKFCKLSVPPPLTTTTGAARVVFVGEQNPSRPASRKGVRVTYHVIE